MTTCWEPGGPTAPPVGNARLTKIGDLKATLTEADLDPSLDGLWADSASWPTPHNWDQL